MANIFYQKMKSRNSFTKELARQKIKIDTAFKVKPTQNQNEKSTIESNSTNKAISKSMKQKATFNLNESRNKSRKCHKILFNEVREKLRQADKKRMRTARENLMIK